MQNYITLKFNCQRDGLTIRGIEYRPEGSNLPIAIVSHGFMANHLTTKHYAKYLASIGYAAFCFDFCGGSVIFGKSDGKTTDMSVLTEVRDLLAVIEYAKSLAHTDSTNILLMGCSQGGFVSAITASRLQEEIKKLVLFYPALSIPDDARRGKMMWARFDPQNVPEFLKCGPMKLGRRYVTDVINMDLFGEIDGYKGDVLIVHGTADKIVDMKYAEQAFATYQSKPYVREVDYYTIEGGKHMFAKKHDKIALQYLGRFAEIDK